MNLFMVITVCAVAGTPSAIPGSCMETHILGPRPYPGGSYNLDSSVIDQCARNLRQLSTDGRLATVPQIAAFLRQSGAVLQPNAVCWAESNTQTYYVGIAPDGTRMRVK
jgi:hypothetical protein